MALNLSSRLARLETQARGPGGLLAALVIVASDPAALEKKMAAAIAALPVNQRRRPVLGISTGVPRADDVEAAHG